MVSVEERAAHALGSEQSQRGMSVTEARGVRWAQHAGCDVRWRQEAGVSNPVWRALDPNMTSKV